MIDTEKLIEIASIKLCEIRGHDLEITPAWQSIVSYEVRSILEVLQAIEYAKSEPTEAEQ